MERCTRVRDDDTAPDEGAAATPIVSASRALRHTEALARLHPGDDRRDAVVPAGESPRHGHCLPQGQVRAV